MHKIMDTHIIIMDTVRRGEGNKLQHTHTQHIITAHVGTLINDTHVHSKEMGK